MSVIDVAEAFIRCFGVENPGVAAAHTAFGSSQVEEGDAEPIETAGRGPCTP